MNATKQALRAFFRKKRNLFVQENKDNLTDHFYQKYSNVIADLLINHDITTQNAACSNPINIGAFYPVKNEVNCLSIIRNLRNVTRSYSFSLPVVPADGGRVLTFRQYNDESSLVPGAFQIPVPREDAPIVYPDALLVPMLCFTQSRYRLGYGGGYYDNTIAALKEKKPHLLTIGIAFNIQESNEMPLEQHDTQLDYILTENRLFH